MTYETKIANIIVRLKEVKKNSPEYTLQKISDHTGVSFSTVSRIFADGSETVAFRYESIRPIAQMLLGIDNLDEGDTDEKALKAVIQYKDTVIQDLQRQLDEERKKHERKMENERTSSRTRIDFLKHQVELKDDRITMLLHAVEKRDEQFHELHRQYLDAVKELLEGRTNA